MSRDGATNLSQGSGKVNKQQEQLVASYLANNNKTLSSNKQAKGVKELITTTTNSEALVSHVTLSAHFYLKLGKLSADNCRQQLVDNNCHKSTTDQEPEMGPYLLARHVHSNTSTELRIATTNYCSLNMHLFARQTKQNNCSSIVSNEEQKRCRTSSSSVAMTRLEWQLPIDACQDSKWRLISIVLFYKSSDFDYIGKLYIDGKFESIGVADRIESDNGINLFENKENYVNTKLIDDFVLIVNAVDSQEIINCISDCAEKFIVDSEISNNSTNYDTTKANITQVSQTKVLVEANSFIDASDAIKTRVRYANYRLYPSSNDRLFVVRSHFKCTQLSLAEFEYANEARKTLEHIHVTNEHYGGNEGHDYDNDNDIVDFERRQVFEIKANELVVTHINNIIQNGIDLFPNFSINIKDNYAQRQQTILGDMIPIEGCKILLKSRLDLNLESLSFPIDIIREKNLSFKENIQNESSIVISNTAISQSYEQVFKSIKYKYMTSNNKNRESTNNDIDYLDTKYDVKLFQLSCYDLNGTLFSNKLLIKLVILPEKFEILSEADTNYAKKIHLSSNQHLNINKLNTYKYPDKQTMSHLRQSVFDLQPEIRFDDTTTDNKNNKLISILDETNQRDNFKRQIDRLVVAFIVFMVSLIVIVLLIALANLQIPGEIEDYVKENYDADDLYSGDESTATSYKLNNNKFIRLDEEQDVYDSENEGDDNDDDDEEGEDSEDISRNKTTTSFTDNHQLPRRKERSKESSNKQLNRDKQQDIDVEIPRSVLVVALNRKFSNPSRV